MNMKETTYNLKGGDMIVATSPSDFLRKLHQGSRFDSGGTDEEFMQRFAHRLRMYDGSVVRTDTPDVFLADLLACEFVTVVPCDAD